MHSEAQKKPKDVLEGLDSTLNQLLTDYKAAGFSVAVVLKDSLIYAKGFGYRDLEHHLPVNENTLFAIGSSTKAFTAALKAKGQNSNSPLSTHFNFRNGEDGSIDGVTIPFGEEDNVLFKHFAVSANIGTDELQKYVGNYSIAGMEIKITVKNCILLQPNGTFKAMRVK